jgi:exodeoxyribonuclease V alpha subunit
VDFAVEQGSVATIWTDLDRHFADFMVRLSPDLDDGEKRRLWLASALASSSIGKGHVCLDLAAVAGLTYSLAEDGEGTSIACPGLDEWVEGLRRAPVVGDPGRCTPLVLDGQYRLYLYRYWLYQTELARGILKRAGAGLREVDEGLLADGLRRMFPGGDEGEPDWQRVAALLCVSRGFSVISGGPGTGKTFTVAGIMALLLEQAGERSLHIGLAAPTGKAAARLAESIKGSKGRLDCGPEIKERIPDESSTIHRLLEPLYGTKRFRFNRDNPLPHDVVVVDEASMIDLPLMAKLMEALAEGSRLLLLGDKDQLASVEPGAVFGDICSAGGGGTFSPAFGSIAERIARAGLPSAEAKAGPLQDCTVFLRRNYRFDKGSGIASLAAAINEGDVEGVRRIFSEGVYSDVSWQRTPEPEALANTLEKRFLGFYRTYFKTGTPEEAFELFGRFHILCALRHGPYGIGAVNGMIGNMCSRAGLIGERTRWYRGQPLMVTANDYHLKLYNGDVGILFPDPGARGSLRAYFSAEDGRFRTILPTRLSAYETVYAMTVHKSQGSEFDHVLLLLPDRPSQVVTRELIYTAVTRAKRSVEIWGPEGVLYEAVAKRTERKSGLRDALEAGP